MPIYWSTEAQRRKYHKLPCAQCGAVIWTSSIKGKSYICIDCRRAAGLVANGREGSYTTLATPPAQVPGYGRCVSCGREDQRLANGRCEDCRFYSISDIDPDKSDNARKAKGGQNDFVKRRR